MTKIKCVNSKYFAQKAELELNCLFDNDYLDYEGYDQEEEVEYDSVSCYL